MEGEKLPDDWMEGAILKIVKKGALSNLSVSSKILAKLIIGRSLKQRTSNSDKSKQVFKKDEDT